jgi:uncharacterized membrane protein YhfC
MRPKILIVLGVLFAAVSMQAARSAALKFSVLCNTADSCTVTGSGFAPKASYQLGVSDNCSVFLFGSAVNTSNTGNLSLTISPGESSGCDVKGWTFTLFTIGRKPSQVATFVASDPD